MKNTAQKAVSKMTGLPVDFILYYDTDDNEVKVQYETKTGNGRTLSLQEFKNWFDIIG